jgi:hypothetical protein
MAVCGCFATVLALTGSFFHFLSLGQRQAKEERQLFKALDNVGFQAFETELVSVRVDCGESGRERSNCQVSVERLDPMQESELVKAAGREKMLDC